MALLIGLRSVVPSRSAPAEKKDKKNNTHTASEGCANSKEYAVSSWLTKHPVSASLDGLQVSLPAAEVSGRFLLVA